MFFSKSHEPSSSLKKVIANFSATWCGPCKVVAPFFIELSEKHPSIMFLLVDVDELSVKSLHHLSIASLL